MHALDLIDAMIINKKLIKQNVARLSRVMNGFQESNAGDSGKH